MEKPPYSPPTAQLETNDPKEILAADFSTLNIWRKIFLIILWCYCGIATATLCYMYVDSGNEVLSLGMIIFIWFFLLAITYWTHWAIVKKSRPSHNPCCT